MKRLAKIVLASESLPTGVFLRRVYVEGDVEVYWLLPGRGDAYDDFVYRELMPRLPVGWRWNEDDVLDIHLLEHNGFLFVFRGGKPMAKWIHGETTYSTPNKDFNLLSRNPALEQILISAGAARMREVDWRPN